MVWPGKENPEASGSSRGVCGVVWPGSSVPPSPGVLSARADSSSRRRRSSAVVEAGRLCGEEKDNETVRRRMVRSDELMSYRLFIFSICSEGG